jgi:two-component system, OmpR family, sensor kinase
VRPSDRGDTAPAGYSSERRRPSLGRVLVLSFGAVAVAAVVLTAIITIVLARADAPSRAIEQLRGEAESGADVAADLPCDPGRRPMGHLTQELGPRARFVPDGAPRPRGAEFRDPEGRVRMGTRDVVYASARATLCGRPGRLYVSRASSDVPVLPEGFASRLLLACLVALAISAVVAYPLARRLARPLRDLAGSARAFALGRRGSAPVHVSDTAEIAELKDAFDGMMSDLESARQREKTFLLNVSHELRTPLTAIRGYGEALADGTTRKPVEAGEVVVRESHRLERLVGDLLDLARLESGEFSVRPVDVDLAAVAADVARALRPFATDNGLDITVAADGASIVRTDPDRVHQMLANLAENALRVSPRGSSVAIEVGDGVVAVSDRGPGLDGADLDHAFDRFYLWSKYKGERPVGSGLGLAIVGELARRLNAEVGVRSSSHGSRFEIRFEDA